MVSGRWNRVEFTTYDGLKLRGNWFESPTAAGTATSPAVIITQGLGLQKEHYLQNWAERFQDAGFHVLIYDHRNFGDSEGHPRCEIDVQQQADDYSDAVTYVRGLNGVDASKVFLWGVCHAGGAAGTAAATDRRIAGVILLMPSQSGKFYYDNWPAHLRERYEATRAMGRDAADAKAEYFRLWPVTAADRAGQGESIYTDDVSYNWTQGAVRLTDEGGSTFDNKVAITSLHSIFSARPGALFKEISPTPVLFLAAKDDLLAAEFEVQTKTYAEMGEPKEFVALNGGHLTNYFGEQFEVGVQAMIQWLKKYSQ